MTRDEEINAIERHILVCEASGRHVLPDRRNRQEHVRPLIAATLRADDDNLHGLKLQNRVRKECGFGVMEWLAIIGFVSNLIRLALEWRRNREAMEGMGS